MKPRPPLRRPAPLAGEYNRTPQVQANKFFLAKVNILVYSS